MSKCLPRLDLDDVLSSMPLGFFHFRLLLMGGMGFMADAMEVSLLSYMSVCVGSDWNLSQPEIASITSVVFMGELLGSTFWGPFADKFGRRIAYLGAILFITIGGFLSAISNNLPILLFLRFIVGFGVGGTSVPFDLLAEFLPSGRRGSFLMYIELFWTLGSVLVSGMAWAFLSVYGWRALTIITALPVTLACLLSIMYMPESARWHLENGRRKEAEAVLRTACVVNSSELAPFILSSHTDSSKERSSRMHTSHHSELSENSQIWEEDRLLTRTSQFNHYIPSSIIRSSFFLSSFCQLFSSQQWKITIVLFILWSLFGFAYYGLVLFVSRVFQNPTAVGCSFEYSAVFINASFEVLGVVTMAMSIDSVGRVPCQFVMYCAAGIAVMLMGLITTSDSLPLALHLSQERLMVGVAGIARLCIMGASSATWVTTPELFPTRMRATGHSMTNAMARVGGVIAPFLVQNDGISLMRVAVILGSVNILAGCMVLMLPETKDRPLDQH